MAVADRGDHQAVPRRGPALRRHRSDDVGGDGGLAGREGRRGGARRGGSLPERVRSREVREIPAAARRHRGDRYEGAADPRSRPSRRARQIGLGGAMSSLRLDTPWLLLIAAVVPMLLYLRFRHERTRRSSFRYPDLGILRGARKTLATRLHFL